VVTLLGEDEAVAPLSDDELLSDEEASVALPLPEDEAVAPEPEDELEAVLGDEDWVAVDT
jgi:hypothetical protein